ncbi:MAG TPA: hypothetical protein ENI94_04505 [Gammaproteobacteria bacterium]|nr:hypothetical protein [Gammaproteobacteria bacterium]
MNENKIILTVVAVATVLMFLFLPTFTFHEEGLRGEYHFILNIPADHQINGPLILVEWLGIVLFAAVAWTLVGSRNNKRKKAEKENEESNEKNNRDENVQGTTAVESVKNNTEGSGSESSGADSGWDQAQK